MFKGILTTDISDHLPIFYIVFPKITTSKTSDDYFFKRSSKKANRDKFSELLSAWDTSDILATSDMQEAYTHFYLMN